MLEATFPGWGASSPRGEENVRWGRKRTSLAEDVGRGHWPQVRRAGRPRPSGRPTLNLEATLATRGGAPVVLSTAAAQRNATPERGKEKPVFR